MYVSIYVCVVALRPSQQFFSHAGSRIFSMSQDAMVLQTCHERKCLGLVSLQLDQLKWETVSPRTHRAKIVIESMNGPLQIIPTSDTIYKTVCLQNRITVGILMLAMWL